MRARNGRQRAGVYDVVPLLHGSACDRCVPNASIYAQSVLSSRADKAVRIMKIL